MDLIKKLELLILEVTTDHLMYESLLLHLGHGMSAGSV